MASKNPEIETSKSEQERLLVKAEIKKKLKSARQRLTKTYGKNFNFKWEDIFNDSSTIRDPHFKEMVKDIANCRDALDKLETAPKRFSDQKKHLEEIQNDLNIDPDALKTLFKALELAEKYQPLLNEIIRLQVEIIAPMVKHSAAEAKEIRANAKGELTKEGRAKADRAYISQTRVKRTKPGKQSKWNKEDERKLINRWNYLDGMIDKNLVKKSIYEQRKENLKIIKNEFHFNSLNAAYQKLHRLGVPNVPACKTKK